MRFLLLASVVLATLAASRVAHAGDPAAGEAAFNAGLALAEQEKWAEACPKFLASVQFDPQLGARLHLANCYEKIGKLASSWASWKEGLELAKEKNDERVPTIQERIAALEPRLPHLRLDVAHPEVPLVVKRDEAVVPSASFGLALPVDPGPIAITVLRGEQVLERRQVNAEEAKFAALSLDLAAIQAAHPVPKPPPPKLPPAAKPYNPAQRYAGIGIGAAGLAATLVAGGLEIGALVKKGQANDPSNCVEKLCTSAGTDAARDGARLATVGQWLGIGGIVVLGVGIAVFATAPSPPKVEPTTALLLPWIDGQNAGVHVVGRW
jgi:tetratricopeptide (TPR) repeat protein